MKIGISSPIVALAGKRPDWEKVAGPAELIRVAQAADRLGFDFMTCGDHVAVPAGIERGERFYDPLATFSYLAALTTRLRFLPYVLVLPFYHPLELASRYGCLDHLSGGRLILGLGVGNLEEEFDMLGKPFHDRGARADDALKALRASLGRRSVSYDGPYYSFDNLVVDPHAAQEHLPLWIGGHSKRALRRAVTLADGWSPAPQSFRGPTPELMRQMLDEAEAPAGFQVVFSPEHRQDAINNPEGVLEMLATSERAGGTHINLPIAHRSLEEFLDQLEAFAELAALEVEAGAPA